MMLNVYLILSFVHQGQVVFAEEAERLLCMMLILEKVTSFHCQVTHRARV